MQEEITHPPTAVVEASSVIPGDEPIDKRFEFTDNQGRLVFEVNPIGLDAMNPDGIEGWSFSMPLTAMFNEVGSIQVTYKCSSGEEPRNIVAQTMSNGDRITLYDKISKKSVTIIVSIDPDTMKLSLDLEKQP